MAYITRCLVHGDQCQTLCSFEYGTNFTFYCGDDCYFWCQFFAWVFMHVCAICNVVMCICFFFLISFFSRQWEAAILQTWTTSALVIYNFSLFNIITFSVIIFLSFIFIDPSFYTSYSSSSSLSSYPNRLEAENRAKCSLKLFSWFADFLHFVNLTVRCGIFHWPLIH